MPIKTEIFKDIANVTLNTAPKGLLETVCWNFEMRTKNNTLRGAATTTKIIIVWLEKRELKPA